MLHAFFHGCYTSVAWVLQSAALRLRKYTIRVQAVRAVLDGGQFLAAIWGFFLKDPDEDKDNNMQVTTMCM